MDEEEIVCVGALHLLGCLDDMFKIERRWSTHPLLANRLTTGQFHIMFKKHRQYTDKFFQYYRMSVTSFDELLFLISDSLTKQNTNMKRSIEVAERLVITLRYLASGMSFGDLEYHFHVSRKTVLVIVKETCEAIWKQLQPTEMPPPTMDKWEQIIKDFESLTNCPNCIGAIDGKHIRLNCPPNSESECFNYKKYFSIVLLAVSDAKLNFTAIDVGAYGREGDSTIFKNSNFYQRLKNEILEIPKDRPLPVPQNVNLEIINSPMPLVLLGDEAFGLTRRIMRPYPNKNLTAEKRTYHYRHCRARRVVECSFGILSNKWRVLHSCILVDIEFATTIVQNCCVLHNFVKKRDGYIFEDTLGCELETLSDQVVVGGRSTGIEIRDSFCNYFNGPGALPWQGKYV